MKCIQNVCGRGMGLWRREGLAGKQGQGHRGPPSFWVFFFSFLLDVFHRLEAPHTHTFPFKTAPIADAD